MLLVGFLVAFVVVLRLVARCTFYSERCLKVLLGCCCRAYTLPAMLHTLRSVVQPKQVLDSADRALKRMIDRHPYTNTLAVPTHYARLRRANPGGNTPQPHTHTLALCAHLALALALPHPLTARCKRVTIGPSSAAAELYSRSSRNGVVISAGECLPM